MPRENSFSDSDGRSLTPDLEEEASGAAPPLSPVYSNRSPTNEKKAHVDPPTSTFTKYPQEPSLKSPVHMTPKDRFRSAVRKIMALHRTSTIIASYGAGAEPGVDPRRSSAELQYGSVKEDCVIQIFDYSAVRNSFGQMTNKEFVDLMENPAASAREPWVKVRWINIGGISWDVIRAVSIKYDLHPLAVEDVFHKSGYTRSKADYYSKHLFLKILCHELTDMEQSESSFGDDIPRSTSPVPYYNDKMVYGSVAASRQSTLRNRKHRATNPSNDLEGRLLLPSLVPKLSKDLAAENRRKREAEEVAIQLLKENKVNVKVSPMFIFLLRDGTVISMHDNPDVELTRPIAHRLNQRDTVLRTSADPSLLVHSLLDLVVDKALEVIDEYQLRIMKLERTILLSPTIKAVKKLHVLSGDLILHKRTLEPIKTVVYGLRRYDLDRCAALIDSSVPSNANVKIVGYMSHKSKIYLADVHDHMEYILTTLDMIANIGENLQNYAFNMKSYEMNVVMRRLTLATIIFLPLTLLTGYFGMNFTYMWSIHTEHSDVVFWIIALPLMAIVIPSFLFSDIQGMIHYVHKKFIAKKLIQNVRSP